MADWRKSERCEHLPQRIQKPRPHFPLNGKKWGLFVCPSTISSALLSYVLRVPHKHSSTCGLLVKACSGRAGLASRRFVVVGYAQ